MNSVRAFEAAARHSSFTRAADELFVTPGAVSRQVRILEASLGKPLFERNYREVRLTEAGSAYARAITDAFGQIEIATREFLATEPAKTLHVHVPMTFAMFWLMPRLASFHAQHPREGLRLASAGNPPPNLAGTDYDVAIKRMNGVPPEICARRLFDVDLAPACSPALRDGARLRKPADLVGKPLLYSTARPADWSIWLDAAGVGGIEMRHQVPFASTSLSCQAAMNGVGIAIITRAFAEDQVRKGALVFPFDVSATDASAYYAVIAAAARGKPQVQAFCDWIVREASQAAAAPAPGR
jgi:LysR family glycine cleavage system transcriptional activator